MRNSSLNIEDIERILDATMQIASNQCTLESDGTLTVQLRCREEILTVVGIKAAEFKNPDAVKRLALSLLDELQATSHLGGPVLASVESPCKEV